MGEETNGNGSVRITTAKVYELLTETHEDVLSLRAEVQMRLAVVDGELTRLAKAEDLHTHETLIAHKGLVSALKWSVGSLLALGSLALAVFTQVR
jgi:hypothetical protein